MWPEPAAAAGSMSAGPQLQLALLWPWLLMATLQAGLGQKGLAAAVESERAAAQKAIIRVIPLKVEPIILEGEFANVAEVTPAEGKLLQVRAALFYPLRLPRPLPPCPPVSPPVSPSASAPSTARLILFPGCRCPSEGTRRLVCEPSTCAFCSFVPLLAGLCKRSILRSVTVRSHARINAGFWLWSVDPLEIIAYLN